MKAPCYGRTPISKVGSLSAFKWRVTAWLVRLLIRFYTHGGVVCVGWYGCLGLYIYYVVGIKDKGTQNEGNLHKTRYLDT